MVTVNLHSRITEGYVARRACRVIGAHLRSTKWKFFCPKYSTQRKRFVGAGIISDRFGHDNEFIRARIAEVKSPSYTIVSFYCDCSQPGWSTKAWCCHARRINLETLEDHRKKSAERRKRKAQRKAEAEACVCVCVCL